jgi:hypothetical protein
MTEWRMTEIVCERQGLRQVLIEAKRARKRAGNLDDFQSVRQPRSEMIAFVIDEDLRLVGKPPEGRGMDNPVTIPPEGVPRRTDRLGKSSTPALRGIGSINRPFTPDFDRHHIFCRWRMILSENRCPLFRIMR